MPGPRLLLLPHAFLGYRAQSGGFLDDLTTPYAVLERHSNSSLDFVHGPLVLVDAGDAGSVTKVL